jgi:hypothetical protein
MWRRGHGRPEPSACADARIRDDERARRRDEAQKKVKEAEVRGRLKEAAHDIAEQRREQDVGERSRSGIGPAAAADGGERPRGAHQ